MTKEEFVAERNKLADQHQKDLKELTIKYVLANNPYKEGDIIKDHVGSIKIESIGFYGSTFIGTPSCAYTGIELKKDGTPKKANVKRTIYQENVRQ
jgi:hypothetical protein